MPLTFGQKIKDARTSKKFTQKQLAEKIGAAHNSISDWENDKNKPDPDTIELLCGVLEITPNYLLATTSSEDFSPSDKLLVKRYNSLDETGKKRIDTILDWEEERMQALKSNGTATTSSGKRLVNYYYRLASAGSGQIIFDTPPTKHIEIPDIADYRNVSYAIGVNGNSMEPTYNDGDMLLVEITENIEPGQIGIFLVNGESYVKKLGNGELISLNKEYGPIPLTEDSRCMGKVIDKLTDI